MELIIVLLCFLLILCFLKIKENFDTYNSHLHIHTNKDPNHHLNSHTHPTLPIANPNFKFEERKMICEQIDNIDTCEYYGCKWDKNKKICRNPDTVCDKIKTFSGTIKQRKGICDTLDNCKWYEATSECSSDILCPEYKRADTNCTNYTDCENTSKKCLPHCKSATIINSGEMCVPKIQTCKDLEMKLSQNIKLISKNFKEIVSEDLFNSDDEKIVVLENIRFYPEEEKNDQQFAKYLET